jgi:hypothetical protein
MSGYHPEADIGSAGIYIPSPLDPILDEFQKVFVDRLGIGGEHAMREAGIELKSGILEELDLEQGGAFVGNNLVVFPLNDECWQVEVFQVLGGPCRLSNLAGERSC